jgi:hypothetical protein
MIKLGPVVNSVPTTSISHHLIFSVNNLMWFGASDIGTTVSGDVSDIAEHYRSVLDAFPHFIGLTVHSIQALEHTAMQKYIARREAIRRESLTKKRFGFAQR